MITATHLSVIPGEQPGPRSASWHALAAGAARLIRYEGTCWPGTGLGTRSAGCSWPAASAYATSTAAVNLLGLGGTAGWSTVVLRLLAWLFMLAWPWAIGLCLPLALLLFPDGRPAGRRWCWLIWAIVAEGVLFELSFAAPGRQTFGRRSVVPYLAIPLYDRLGALWAASNIAWAALFVLVLASLVVRYRRGGDVERI